MCVLSVSTEYAVRWTYGHAGDDFEVRQMVWSVASVERVAKVGK